ncbi:MAG: arsenate reductase ArsC [Dehalococcoidales bacterium]|nr:arsenate reductase ArsC [Dehalococcoidales bacterium]
MLKILFVCVHNSGRSQMAKAFFNKLADGKGTADSAGTKPDTKINPMIIRAMQETGIDISHETPKLLTLELAEQFDRMITMGCGVEETCPARFLPTEDWGLPDPAGQPIEVVRQIRDQVRARVEKLVAGL